MAQANIKIELSDEAKAAIEALTEEVRALRAELAGGGSAAHHHYHTHTYYPCAPTYQPWQITYTNPPIMVGSGLQV